MAYANMLFLILFLAATLLSQTLLKTVKQKNVALLLSSVVFYFWAGPGYMLIPLILSALYWIMGLLLQSKKDKKYLVIPVVLTVALMVFFKYSAVILNGTQSLIGVPEEIPTIVIPLGIMFYSLNLISYLGDIYHGEIKAETSLLNMLTYGMNFHVALGGPVVRYKDVRRELSARKTNPQNISSGITRFTLGLFKRFLLAEPLTAVEDHLLVRSAEGLASVPVMGIILGVLMSSLRLYITLSAYSDMAVGLGLISGFRYGENFKYPLLSCSMRGFLSKWCCSVTAFFDDYVAVPLSRRMSRPVALLAAYVLLGLWFGLTLGNVILGVWVALFVFLEEKFLRHIDVGSAGILGCIAIFLFHFFYAFTTGERLLIALKGLFGMNRNGFWDSGILDFLPEYLPVLLLCLCFCLPIGTLLRNLWRNVFKENVGMLSLAITWENVYPILLLALTLLFIMLGVNPFMPA